MKPLTLAQFRLLTDRHGADLARWPPQERARAHALLSESAQARALLAQAHLLDTALRSAGRQVDHGIWTSDAEKAAALARLRQQVAMRLASQPLRQTFIPPVRPAGWLAVAAGLLVTCSGFLIGSHYSATADEPADSLMTALQPDPIHLQAD